MATEPKGSDVAMQGNAFAQNAGEALDLLVPGPHRDKAIARMFGVSVRMAKYLRAGKCWTVERLSIASRLLGQDFDELLVPMRCIVEPMLPSPTEEIHQRLDRLESQLAELAKNLRGKE